MKNENKIIEERTKILTDGAKKCLLITEKGMMMEGASFDLLALLTMLITELKGELPIDVLETSLKMGLMSDEEKLKFMADELEKMIKDGKQMSKEEIEEIETLEIDFKDTDELELALEVSSKKAIYLIDDLIKHLFELQQENQSLKKENKILRENAEHNDRVVDRVNWENQKLKKELEEYKRLGFEHLNN